MIRFKQFLQFGIVGISNTVISYFVYLLLVNINVNYLIANICGFLVSVVNAFYWNNKYVFKQKAGEKRALFHTFFKTFMSYAGSGLILANLLLILWVSILHVNEMAAPILNLFITIPLNYILNKYWAFKSRK